MNWLRSLWAMLRRDPDRERKNMELTRLTIRSQQAEARSARIRAEQQQLISALRNTVKVMRSEPRK